MSDAAMVVGYVLFGISELLALVPVPPNGILNSILIGIRNSFSNPSHDIEMAQTLINSDTNVANVLNTIGTNPVLANAMKVLAEHPSVIPHVSTLSASQDLQYIITLLSNNPEMIDTMKSLIINAIANKTANH